MCTYCTGENVKTLNKKIVCFEEGEANKIVEVIEWENEPFDVSLNLPKGDYEIADDFIIITTDFGKYGACVA